MKESHQPRIYKIAIMILPIGVVIGTAVFMWMYFAKHQEDSNEQSVIVAPGIRMSDLDDMVGKFTDRIGSRTTETEEGRVGLRRAASMIEGRLGPQNVGFKVRKDEGIASHDLLWKSLWVDVRGVEKPEEVVIAAVAYAGAGKTADANTVSTLMMVASSMAREKPMCTIRFVFLPFERLPEEQDRWLVDHCLMSGESCVGIIGLEVMDKAPKAGDDDWHITAPEPADQAWWEYLGGGKEGGKFNGGKMPSVWVTHAVFSSQVWQNERDQRLQATLTVAQEIREWLQMAAK